MKKFFALILAILMAMPLFTTATAEDWEDGGYPDIYLDDATIKTIVGSYYSHVITAAKFKDGALAIMDGNKIGYFEGGNLVMEWSHPTTDFDFFFDVFDYPDAEYSICAVLGSDLVSFRDDLSMHIEAQNLYQFSFGEDAVYAYVLTDDGSLYYWSPYVYLLIAHDVEQAISFYGVTFFISDGCVYVVGAYVFDIGKMTQEYYRHHELHVIPLGPGHIDDYVDEAFGEEFEPNDERMAAFCEKYDFSFASVGQEMKYDITIEDFTDFPYTTVNYCLATFDLPADEYADPLVFTDISFYGNYGDLMVYLANDVELKQIRWVSVNSDDDSSDELFGLVASRCDWVGDGKVPGEEVYRYGDQLIHVGNLEDGRVYIYANNMRKVNE